MALTKKRIGRMMGEAAVIVGSILLAFWIDAWWASQQDLARERTILESIRVETLENQSELALSIQQFEQSKKSVDAFFRMSASELAALTPDSAAVMIDGIILSRTYDPQTAAATMLLSTSQPLSNQGLRIRQLTSTFLRLIGDADEEKTVHYRLMMNTLEQLARSSIAAASEGVGRVTDISARVGPKVLSDLRTNDDFMTVLMVKQSSGMVYRSELEQVSESLIELVSILNQAE